MFIPSTRGESKLIIFAEFYDSVVYKLHIPEMFEGHSRIAEVLAAPGNFICAVLSAATKK